MKNIRREIEIADLLGMEEGISRPSWYGTSASYLRGYARTRHCPASSLLPEDQKITAAVHRLYERSNDISKGIMDNSSNLTGRARAKIFNKLVYELALEAGLTAAAVLPPETEE